MRRNKHITTVHARCPYMPVWDYYTVTIQTNEFVRCEDVQAICDEVRGKNVTQEQLFDELKPKMPQDCILTVEGCHGQNGRLVISG